ncbi:hypothetical protein ASPNIDRAFT_212193 [Aspergillus niger ATCC 1015]|uniref:Uncharacterized protein n=1 Tax=Aspergillus niger (strain ATCC 1015 / CBS 113.46 / FGSC A1144 / LSHB Ac4 / NCTC 3858a / NRRL 328 / USDA 3528.7) TaxID=380704 RepID=G3YEG3_ASPNA|nr:hypothetical protein ASPNIDRAFT_212193 [Aspergillus niger ATCC 1015]
MDSPAVPAPLDPKEQPILERLLRTRDALILLKQDKSSYIKSRDVLPLYEEVVAEVEKLNAARKEQDCRRAHNRLDYVLDDCFQLISLLFLTVGRNNEAPAVYPLLTLQRLLDHLEEAGFYSSKDLISITKTLANMNETLDRCRQAYSPALITLLESRLEKCQLLLEKLQSGLAKLGPELAATHETLVSILRSTSAVNTRSKFSSSEVTTLRTQLKKIEEGMKDGQFVDAEGVPLPGAQQDVKLLMERCWLWTEIVLERQGKIDERFKEQYDRLIEIRNQLDRLAVTQAWSLRETDLFGYQRKLDRIDEARVNGNFVDAEGNAADIHAQRTLLYLIRRSYGYIYALLISSEPVSEALLPVYNQLQTLRKCLLEVQESGGVSNSRELYPYSMKLNSIDNMRVDGKFYVGTDIPEGQGSVNALLAECYDIVWELRAAVDEDERTG